MSFESWLNVVIVILTVPSVTVSILTHAEWISKQYKSERSSESFTY